MQHLEFHFRNTCYTYELAYQNRFHLFSDGNFMYILGVVFTWNLRSRRSHVYVMCIVHTLNIVCVCTYAFVCVSVSLCMYIYRIVLIRTRYSMQNFTRTAAKYWNKTMQIKQRNKQKHIRIKRKAKRRQDKPSSAIRQTTHNQSSRTNPCSTAPPPYPPSPPSLSLTHTQ